MSWDDIRYFLAVMRGGSLSAAARALQVQHSTVARRIDALESALGIRLFDRLPRGWPPTDEGLHLAEHAARLEADAHAFARAAQGAAALDGVVRVSASPVFASHFLAPRLARAQRAWPALRIDLMGEMHAANLYAREADLAVRLSRPSEPGLAARRLGTMRFALCAAPEWADAPPDTWPFVGYDDALAQTPQQQWLERVAAGRRFAFIANDLAAQHRACAAGAGVALLPRFLVDDPAAHAGAPLVELTAAPRCDIEREIWLVVHPDVRRSPRVQRVADAIADAVHAADGRL
ncbi:LysR family transcriptional regulator [Burkholderia orbicola]|uniref:LysR family transcriptional regulator n=3 Tax=Burkholderia cepacia complex TaxID=87882 RepID=A0A3N9FA93_9BURK|nr:MULTISPECIES: LysR family transcriptional regulator [Burkholderia]EKS9845524.1 LysR family transcriptional regulator [Burkholderia cepacia]BEV49722.1 LysR substrate-binding domain-containing protein [Burkholderia contaminans]AQT54187.1 LysR family transcriptional regulator [Burkholderia cenocepacia]AWG28345.1 LysR family transcriptional regulator [Burkholderia cenocepacia]ELK7719674.1 LysR family transcriptional regulator [Burkholderia cenocepacia]